VYAGGVIVLFFKTPKNAGARFKRLQELDGLFQFGGRISVLMRHSAGANALAVPVIVAADGGGSVAVSYRTIRFVIMLRVT